jgi:hypothetical protein
MTDGLQKLFGSAARVKLLRLFLFNSRQSFSVAEAAEHSRTTPAEAKRELKLFLQVGLIKRVRVRVASSKAPRFGLDEEFTYLQALQALLLNAPERGKDIYDRIRRTGVLKLLILSGIFLGEWEGRLDLFIVGDRVNERALRGHIRRLESEIGKELRYALLTSDDFFYRITMNDHLLRDVLDYPHRIVLDKLNIGLK